MAQLWGGRFTKETRDVSYVSHEKALAEAARSKGLEF